MEFRSAQSRDVPEILALLRQAGNLLHRGRPDLFRCNAQKYGASQVLSMLDSASDPIFVAVEEDKVLACAFCSMEVYSRDPVMNDHYSFRIQDLCVEEGRRRQHIGTELYRQIERYARSRNCHSVTLDVWTCSPEAVKFFESLGLRPRMLGMEALTEEA